MIKAVRVLALTIWTMTWISICHGQGTQQLLINEVFISGFNGSENGDHGFKVDDWFEIYNPSPNAVNLSGYYLSDNSKNPLKYQISSGLINGNNHIVFYANGEDTSTSTNFKLDQGDFNEEIVLSDPSGALIDIYKIRKRTNINQSRGRVSDGDVNWGIFPTPTKNASNNNSIAYPSYTDSPTPSPTAGAYGGPIQVSIPVPSGYTARYTLNSLDPTSTSAVYTSPIQINQTTVLKVKLFDNSGVELESFVKTNTYLINENHSLYTLSVSGKSNILSLINGSINLYPTGTFEWFDESGTRVSTTAGNLNKHGQDSWVYPQRGFDIFVRDEAGYGGAMEHKFFDQKDRESFDRFIIRAAGDDNYPYEEGGAHIRDAFVQEWGAKAGLEMDHRTYRPCIVYLNGNYWGVYEIREKVVHKSFTSYYYDQDEDDLDYISYWGVATQRYGTRTDWDNVVSFILNNNMAIQSNFDFVDNQINLLSLTDYVIYNNYIVSKDWNNYNTAWWRGRNLQGGALKWRYILWDMDASFGHYINYSNVPDITPQASPCDVLDNSPIADPESHLELFEKLIDENSDFNNFVANRYNDLINTYWSCDYSIPLLDELVDEKEPEMPRQISHWWAISQGGWNAGNNSGTIADWEQHVQDIRNFLLARCSYIDSGLNSCLNLGSSNEITFETDPPNINANIVTNTVTIPQTPMTGSYYNNLPLTVRAENQFYYEFSHWTTENGTVIDDLNSNEINVTVSQDDILTANYVFQNKELIINEIHYNPQDELIAGDSISGTNFEFIELKNTSSVAIDLMGLNLTNGVTYHFEESFVVPAGGFVILAEDEDGFQDKYGFAADFIYQGKLSNSGENLYLKDNAGYLVDSLTYQDVFPWDTIPDGGLYSLAYILGSTDNNIPGNWAAQTTYVTPGAENQHCQELIINSVVQDESCPNAIDGSVVSSIENGIGPFFYQWSHGPVGSSLTDMAPGLYILNVIDNTTGCLGADTITVNSIANTLMLSSTIPDDHYRASLVIKSDGQVPPGGIVKMEAGQEIELLSNFESDQDAELYIFIGGCP